MAPNGDVFVADGHSGNDGNNRVVRFSKDGKFVKAWGKSGWAPGEFHAIHAIAIDSRGRVFVGDRGNNRIQIFDQDGKSLTAPWTQFGKPSGIAFDSARIRSTSPTRNQTMCRIPGGKRDPDRRREERMDQRVHPCFPWGDPRHDGRQRRGVRGRRSGRQRLRRRAGAEAFAEIREVRP